MVVVAMGGTAGQDLTNKQDHRSVVVGWLVFENKELICCLLTKFSRVLPLVEVFKDIFTFNS